VCVCVCVCVCVIPLQHDSHMFIEQGARQCAASVGLNDNTLMHDLLVVSFALKKYFN
jgi:hypothetical protein